MVGGSQMERCEEASGGTSYAQTLASTREGRVRAVEISTLEAGYSSLASTRRTLSRADLRF